MKISVVSPVYFAKPIIDSLVDQIVEILGSTKHNYEIVLVDDGSTDGSWDKIAENCAKNPRVKGIKLSRNFGQHHAVTCGLTKASGDLIIIMDCDLQDQPATILQLIDKHLEGFDVVFTKRIKRSHGSFKKVSASIYNALFRLISDSSFDTSFGSMVLITQKVSKQILKLKEIDRLYIQMIKWVGFNQTSIMAEHAERYAGNSTYTFGKLLKLAIAGWTSHSSKLLHFAVSIGFFFSVISFAAIGYVLLMYFVRSLLPGWPSLIAVILFSTGLILMAIGIHGIYIGKIFNQVKSRPLFIIDEILNEEDQ